MLKLDHLALQHPEPEAIAAWLCIHFGLTVYRVSSSASRARFLKCPQTGVMLEIYRQPEAPVPDYAAMPPAVLHIAFYADDIVAEAARLVAAGAIPAGEPGRNSAGDAHLMLRDPWGVPIQLVSRQK
jgi:glyoxylase I family protein